MADKELILSDLLNRFTIEELEILKDRVLPMIINARKELEQHDSKLQK